MSRFSAPTSKRGRRIALSGLIALGVVLATVAPTFAADADGYPKVATSSTSTYTAVPAKGLVNVRVVLKLKNNIPGTVRQINCDNGFFDPYYGWISVPGKCDQPVATYINKAYIWTEKTVANLRITSDGGAVQRKVVPMASADYSKYLLTFPRIFKGHTRTITIDYTIKSGAARSTSTTRINGGYINLAAISQPVDRGSVKVIVPVATDAYSWGSKATMSVSGSKRVFASGTITDPSKFGLGVAGTNAGGFTKATVASGSGRDVEIQAWPGDKVWMQTIKSQVADSLSDLERLVGAPLPGTGPIVVREVTRDALQGYAARYDQESQIAAVSEDLNQPGVIANSLSRAWFNDSMFASAWLSQGYAGWAENGVGGSRPCVAPSRTDLALENWPSLTPTSTPAERQAVDDQFSTACALVSKVSDGAQPQAVAGVIKTLTSQDGAYPGTTDATASTPNTWRQWLDAVDENSVASQDPSVSIESMLTGYKVATKLELTDRHEARTALRDLRTMAGTTWTIPAAVYEPMNAWRFDEAGSAMQSVRSTIADANAVATALPTVAVANSPLQGRLETARTLADVTAIQSEAHDQLATANLLAADVERAHNPNPIEAVGLIGTDVDAMSSDATSSVATMDLTTANARISDLDKVLDGAATTGMLRIAAVLAAVLVVGGAGGLTVRRRRSTSTSKIDGSTES